MKYILSNDMQTLKSTFKIVLIYWCILIFSYLILYSFDFNITNTEKYVFILGLNLNLNNVISISFNILNILIYFILVIKIFTNDIVLGNANLFLRINILKWIVLKNLMIFFVIVLLKATTHIIIGLLCNTVPIYLLSDILFTLLFCNFLILSLMILRNNILVLFSLISYFYLFYRYKLSIINISFNYNYIVFGIILEICSILLFHKRILKLFKEVTDENKG